MDAEQKPVAWPTFEQFAKEAVTSGAANRVYGPNGADVKSYSVFIRGGAAENLPVRLREQEFSDITLHAITEKMGLNQSAFRDCLRMAELIAIRDAWMQGTLIAMEDYDQVNRMSSRQFEQISADYTLLSRGLDHSWIQSQLMEQQQQGKNLGDMVQALPEEQQQAVKERVPDEITRGRIVSQTSDFTMQSTAAGELVAHENKRLGVVPEIGKDVTVTYYQGSGQIFENDHDLTVGEPYVDKDTQDLAVQIHDKSGDLRQIVLFSGVAAFKKFSEAQKLPEALVEKAVEARINSPKVYPSLDKPQRENVTGVYVDPKTNGLAIDYTEHGARSTVVFGSAKALENHAKIFDIKETQVAQAYALERAQSMRHVERKLEADKVETRGPGATMDDARMHAEKAFGGNQDAKDKFLREVAQKTQRDKVRGKEDKER